MGTTSGINDERNSWVRLGDKNFRPLIPHREVIAAIDRLAGRINADYRDKPFPLFMGVLNGSFMFMAELLQRVDFVCETSFVKIASYRGTATSGRVKELIGLTDTLKGRHVIIVEDIVDTGASIDYLMRSLSGHEPASVAVATLLFKPEAYKMDYPVAYRALEVPDRFVIGFGLDYNQMGRNLNGIYELAE